MTHIDDFLKPESMLTPGMAGGMAMMITNTLYVNFGLTQKFTCLIISFVLGMLVFASHEKKIHKKAIYYLLNSLIIFSMAVGTNSVGVKLATADVSFMNDMNFSFIPDAVADVEVPSNSVDLSQMVIGEYSPDLDSNQINELRNYEKKLIDKNNKTKESFRVSLDNERLINEIVDSLDKNVVLELRSIERLMIKNKFKKIDVTIKELERVRKEESVKVEASNSKPKRRFFGGW